MIEVRNSRKRRSWMFLYTCVLRQRTKKDFGGEFNWDVRILWDQNFYKMLNDFSDKNLIVPDIPNSETDTTRRDLMDLNL